MSVPALEMITSLKDLVEDCSVCLHKLDSEESLENSSGFYNCKTCSGKDNIDCLTYFPTNYSCRLEKN